MSECMSFIHIVLIEKNQFMSMQAHYNEAIKLLNSITKKRIYEPVTYGTEIFLDAGYLLIDVDKKMVISVQNAFGIKHLSKDVQKKFRQEWICIELSEKEKVGNKRQYFSQHL